MRVAIVHDWLVDYGGAEHVLEQISACIPNADIFCLVDFLSPENRKRLSSKPVITSFIQRLPFARAKYRAYLLLMPLAVEQFDLSRYDMVISSSHAVAKGVITGPDQLHISYVHTPIRYVWDLQHDYLRESNLDTGVKGWIAKWMLHKMRIWDCRTSNGVDYFMANSRFIARRINKIYKRHAVVVYPPVDISAFTLCAQKEEFYLTCSRLVPYKKTHLIVEAFSALRGKRLVVIGDGPEMERVKAVAGPNVEILGYQPFETLRDYMQRARAFVFAAEEDFGIAVVEAQACGTPVIALGRGGVLESVRASPPSATGVLFPEQTVPSIQAAVAAFEARRDEFDPYACQRNAERFAEARFRREFTAYVLQCCEQFHAARGEIDVMDNAAEAAVYREPETLRAP